MYDLITNSLLCHILHIQNGNKCGTEREILEKRLSAIKNISV